MKYHKINNQKLFLNFGNLGIYSSTITTQNMYISGSNVAGEDNNIVVQEKANVRSKDSFSLSNIKANEIIYNGDRTVLPNKKAKTKQKRVVGE